MSPLLCESSEPVPQAHGERPRVLVLGQCGLMGLTEPCLPDLRELSGSPHFLGFQLLQLDRDTDDPIRADSET